jgi:hypothetical protein
MMQKRRLGRTGLLVSIVGFGGIPIISASRDEAENVVKYAFERGINYFAQPETMETVKRR